MNLTSKAIDIAARTLYGEARGESWEGKVGVAWVIRNRAEKALRDTGKPYWWGETVEEVCLKPGQFSSWSKNDPNLPKMKAVSVSHPVFRECLAAVAAVMSDNVPDPTHGSCHYHTTGVAPNWSKNKVPRAIIGDHRFFNDIDV